MAGILNNSRTGVSANSADKENDKRILNASTRQEIVSARITNISRTGVSANSADRENDERILNAGVG